MTTKRADIFAAIRTRYHGPTNTRGSRISAWRELPFEGGLRAPLPYDLALDPADAHMAAAQAFLDKHQAGCIVDPRGLSHGDGYFWTWTQGDDE